MMIHSHREPLQTYKSYKAEKLNKFMSRIRALITGVNESSLKDIDKKALILLMKKELDK